MTKVRIHELAKELSLSSKDLMGKLNELDIEVASHMSSISEEEANIIRDIFTEKPVVEEILIKEVVSDDSSDSAVLVHDENDRKKNKKKNKKQSSKEQNVKPKEEQPNVVSDVVYIDENIIVKDLAELIGVSTTQIITKLIGLGMMVNQNQTIDFETAFLVSEELGKTVELKEPELPENPEELFYSGDEDSEENTVKRPPVVTVMGHVDHGKTSLLDAIKHTQVRIGEAGGITQHIGAYTVNVNGNKVTFLDTPGHEAFTAMRSRGAQVTDIAILVVAADDGVMPQTKEAISHAKAAGVPIIVAINKIDKDGANIERIKQELVENGLMPEDWGGDVITVPVSAKQQIGISELLDMILLVAEMQELKANPNRNAVGTIIEAQLDKGKGPLATVLIQKGTLKVGDYVVSGTAVGRVRAMLDDKYRRVKKAGPSYPVVILGLSEVPNAGDMIYATNDEKTAKSFAEQNAQAIKDSMLKAKAKVSLDDLFMRIKEGEMKDLNLIIKGDVHGSIEALSQSLIKLDTDEVKINIIHQGVGGITESDVTLASASNAIVIGFNVRPNLNAFELSKKENVDIRTYRVIYEVIEDIEAAVKGMHAPKIVEEVLGRCEVRQTFKLPNGNIIAGIYVLNGKITRNSKIKLLRNDIVIHEGEISSLKRYKDDAKEILTGFEGGLGIDGYNDLKEGDLLEAFILKEISAI